MMNKKRMRRQAALMTAVTAAATFGAVAYFADTATVEGEVTGGTFDIKINGADAAAALGFGGDGLYPVEVAGEQPTKAELVELQDWADRGDIDLQTDYQGPAFAELTSFSAGGVGQGNQTADMWGMFCLGGVDVDENSCADPFNLATGTPTITSFMDANPDLSLLVYLVDNGEQQAQGVGTKVTLEFMGRTGTGTATLPLGAVTPSQPVVFGEPSAPLAAATGDGLVASFDTSALTATDMGYEIPQGFTLTGQLFEKTDDGIWMEAASRKVYVDVVGADYTSFRQGDHPQTLTTDVHGNFSFDLTAELALALQDGQEFGILVADHSSAKDGVTHLTPVKDSLFTSAPTADLLEEADAREGSEDMGGRNFPEPQDGIDAFWPFNTTA